MAGRRLVTEEETYETDEVPESCDEKKVSPGARTDDQDGVEELWHERYNAEGYEREGYSSPSGWSDFSDAGSGCQQVCLSGC